MPLSGPEGELDLTEPPSALSPVPAPPAAVAKPFNPADLLSRVWQQSLPLIQGRLANLERAAQEASAGTLTPSARTEASDLAHKLAGSLGMFGYPTGTDIAREIELMLETPGELDTGRFLRLTADLRSTLSL